jgi:hypothetical protein
VRRLEARLVEDVRALRTRDPRGALLLVAPSRLLGARFRAAIARALHGIAGLHVLTLPDLAERIAAAPLALAGRRPLPPVADRFLLDRAIRTAIPTEGGYFSGVATARNFPAALLRTLLDVKRAGLGAADLEAAFPDSAKVREVAACQRALDAELRRHAYHDASDGLQPYYSVHRCKPLGTPRTHAEHWTGPESLGWADPRHSRARFLLLGDESVRTGSAIHSCRARRGLGERGAMP